jgi:hypothetical protein
MLLKIMTMKLYRFILCTILCFSLQAQNINHSLWTDFLQNHVSKEGQVDYKTISLNPENLNNYLQELKITAPNKTWSKNETLAFWVNAYNAFTIKLIIDSYPIKSIKDIKNPWDKAFIEIGNQTMSLNYIEHQILRKMNEPRIHFAIVCASISCPKLLKEAYSAENLDTQLTKATKCFLSDSTKNDISENKLELSKIFQWFSKDFKQNGSLISFLNQYTIIKISENAKIKFKDYNWNLNE